MNTDHSGGPESVQYDSSRELYRASFDSDAEPVSDVVVRTVAAVTGESVEDLEPIDTVVDPIIFDALVRRRRRHIELSFTYHGHKIIVDSDGEIIVLALSPDGGFSRSFQFDDTDSAADTVVRAIAELRGIDEMDVDPLYDVIDPDALNALFIRSRDLDRDDVTVSFRIDEFWVEIQSEDSVRIIRTST